MEIPLTGPLWILFIRCVTYLQQNIQHHHRHHEQTFPIWLIKVQTLKTEQWKRQYTKIFGNVHAVVWEHQGLRGSISPSDTGKARSLFFLHYQWPGYKHAMITFDTGFGGSTRAVRLTRRSCCGASCWGWWRSPRTPSCWCGSRCPAGCSISRWWPWRPSSPSWSWRVPVERSKSQGYMLYLLYSRSFCSKLIHGSYISIVYK